VVLGGLRGKEAVLYDDDDGDDNGDDESLDKIKPAVEAV
jgi:hypothetical protein